jgi:hypothetical protein
MLKHNWQISQLGMIQFSVSLGAGDPYSSKSASIACFSFVNRASDLAIKPDVVDNKTTELILLFRLHVF